MNQTSLYILLVLAAGAIFTALSTRKRLLNEQALRQEAARRLSESKKALILSQGKQKEASDKLSAIQGSLNRLESKLSEGLKRQEEMEATIAKQRQQLESFQSNSQRQEEHLEAQIQSMSQQLSEAVREKKLAQDELQKISSLGLSKEALEQLEKDRLALQSKLREQSREHKAMAREVAQARDILSKVKPGEHKQLKQKAARMEQLYKSMKGLREMADERSQNLEAAAKLLAQHILGPKALQSDSNSALLAQALESIGGQLVDDEFSKTPLELARPEGASRS